MGEPLFTISARYNKKNSSKCELYEDFVVLTTFCEGGWMPIYDNKTRKIPLSDIQRVVISTNSGGIFTHHPNAVHFVTRDCVRTLDDMFRDPKFTSADYIDQGVQQFCAQSKQDLAEKIGVAAQMKAYIENHNR